MLLSQLLFEVQRLVGWELGRWSVLLTGQWVVGLLVALAMWSQLLLLAHWLDIGSLVLKWSRGPLDGVGVGAQVVSVR